MQRDKIRLPPLNALRTFHAVMRHGSFRSASEELLVSPQAVSQQIKLLEEALAVPLFNRRGRKIEPLDEAVLLSHYVESAFAELAEGVRRVTKIGHRNRIDVNASPYFAVRYLVDRLDQFRTRHPGADIRIKTMVELPDFVSDEVDLAIQWGFGQWKDVEARLLVRDPKIICCTPERAADLPTAEHLRSVPLLHFGLSTGLWPRIFAALGVVGHDIQNEIQFYDAASMRRATLSGLGIGLISVFDAEEDLKSGRLVAPLGVDALAGMSDADVPGFYLVYPRANRRVKIVASFCDWVLSVDWGRPAQPAGDA